MYSLTKPQKLIYDMEKYAGGSIATICGSILIKGSKRIEYIKKAINKLYRLNDALRIRIIETDGIPQQYVSEYVEQKISVLHFKNKVEFNLYAEEYAKEPMDLYDSLCSINAVVLEDSYGILVKLHHIISDAWTLTLVGSQFNSAVNGEALEGHSYIDYISSEQEYLSGKRWQKDCAYYIEQFKKCDDVTYLSDKQAKNYIAKRKTFVIDTEKTKKIAEYAKLNNTSIYILLMTTLGIYINRVKMNQEKFYIGTAILNRANKKEKNTMGMFINTIPVLFELENNCTFKENLDNASEKIIAMLRHQKFNYGDILKTLRNKFDFSGNLYDVMFSYQNAKFTGIDGTFESNWYHCGMQTESLQIHVDDRGNEGILKIHYDYQTEKFTEKEIGRMHEHLFNLFFDAIRNDVKKLHELTILSADEQQKLLYDFNDTAVDYPKDKCVHQLFEEQVEKTPNKTAVIACDKTLTYDELNKLSNKLANALISKGIKTNDLVAFALPRMSYLIAVMFGILKSGAAYMPIDPDYPQDRIDYMIKDSDAKFFITENNINEFISGNEANPNVKIPPDNYCYCIYTSGSTGKPKGTLLYHKGIINLITNLKIYNDISKIDRVGFTTTITFDVATQEILTALLNGFTGVLLPERKYIDINEIIDIIEKHNVDIIYATPSYFDALTSIEENAARILKALNTVVLAGEKFYLNSIARELFSNSDTTFENQYGPAETHVISTTATIKNDSNITIGKPIANTQIYILDKQSNLMPMGQIGELCIAGDGVGAGYLNRPELTAEKFIDNSFRKGKMYKTGDLAYWREDGNIVYVGRNDSQVKIRGLRIELGEIENAICSVEGVSQAVVVVRKDESGRQFICAFYIEKENVDLMDIKSIITSKLPKYMMPHMFMAISEMPLTPSGKIDRKKLPAIDLTSIYNNVPFVKPNTELQKEIADIMKKVLNCSSVGLNDDFFDLGGDSLKAIEFVAKAHNRGIYFNLQAVFDNPNVKELCGYIENGNKEQISFEDMDFMQINKTLSKNTLDNMTVPRRCKVGNVLFAGATGYLGMHILADYLDNDTGIAYCLVRGADKQKATERLNNLLEFYFGNKYINSDRIIVLCADLQKEKFGLNDNEYRDLIKDVKTVINAAASVKHYGSYKYFYETNVETVKNMIAFCKKADVKLIHTSTLSVSGNSFADEFDGHISETEKHFYESSLYIEQPLENVYARSKFEAEKIILEEISNGLKANIMRMGNLTNRFSDGKFQRNHESNAFLNRLKAILNLGVFPEYLMDLYLEFTPVDDAASAVMTIARHFNTEQNLFHINSTKVMYMDKVLECFKKCGIDIQVVDGVKFKEALRNTAKQSGTEYIFETFINDMDENDKLNYDSNIHIENDFTTEYLRKLGFEWSDIDFGYIKRYIEYFRGIGYLGV